MSCLILVVGWAKSGLLWQIELTRETYMLQKEYKVAKKVASN